MANHNKPWNKGLLRADLAPTEHPTTLDIAWAAGIYEGEGSCKAFKSQRSKGFQAGVRVAQKDAWLCPKLRSLFGGHVGVFRIKNDTNPDRWYSRWDLYGARALGFLQTIYKFQSPRRQGQIRVVLDAVRS